MAEKSYTLKVNGTSQTVRSDTDVPLLWAIRDLLGLTGTKYGCGINQCRACTELIRGTPQPSCSTPAASAAGKEITTVEGLERLAKALQDAWVAEQVPQCGYCQSGVLMAAAALLREKPQPTDDDIEAAIKNLCACGTYPRIRRGIKRAAGLL